MALKERKKEEGLKRGDEGGQYYLNLIQRPSVGMIAEQDDGHQNDYVVPPNHCLLTLSLSRAVYGGDRGERESVCSWQDPQQLGAF